MRCVLFPLVATIASAAFLAPTEAEAADIHFRPDTEVVYVAPSELTAGLAFGSSAVLAETLVMVPYAAKGPEKYDAICVSVSSALPSGTVGALVIGTLDGRDVPTTTTWAAPVPLDTSGVHCIEIDDPSAVMLDGGLFDASGSYLNLFSSSKLFVGFLAPETNVNMRTLSASALRTFGRMDNNSASPLRITSVVVNGLSDVPTDISAQSWIVESDTPPWIAMRIL